ncbi:MAG: serine/threonine-protein kinase [Planctomycetaceae bacterium]
MIDSQEDSVVDAVKKYMELIEQGKAPSLDEFLLKYREIAEQLRPALEGLALLHQANSIPVGHSHKESEAFSSSKPIGDFQIVREIGRGGMGIVYEAIQLSLGRHVALKVLPFASGLDEVRLQRFRNEAHAAAGLHHTNIVPVFAVGVDRGVHYYAMQLIDGKTLSDIIDEMRHANSLSHLASHQPIASSVQTHSESSVNLAHTGDTSRGEHSTVLHSNSASRRRYYESAVRMIHQAALALEHAHRYGVVHRDIKPANLLLDSTGKIWVTDFGLAQVQELDSGLTRTGDPIGTLRYMSPEQASGKKATIDHRTDIYSLGVTLYELLTLHPAIVGDGYRELINHVAEKEPVSPRSLDPNLPAELDVIIRKAISKNPAERYQDGQSFADDLECWLEDKPIQARPPTLVESLSKWRRRNSGLVAVVSVILLIATIALGATTLLVWREEQKTKQALLAERKQRELTEDNYRQAKETVDSFISLSESELPNYPMEELKDLRREFLETSVLFYQKFLDQRKDDPELAGQLSSTSLRVDRLTSELQLLNRILPLLHLDNPEVRIEVGVSDDVADDIIQSIESYDLNRRNQRASGNDDNESYLNDFEQEIESKLLRLNIHQIKRLNQIARQQRLPFTFKSTEIVKLLNLTQNQRSEINRIIEVNRPVISKRPFFTPGPGEPADHPARNQHLSDTISKTVDEIKQILTPEQLAQWEKIIGEPFEFRPRKLHRDYETSSGITEDK